MATHEFGIMNKEPVHGERYDIYTPEEYALIPVDDDLIESLLTELNCIDFSWHSLDVPEKGLAYCGITLIPPKSTRAVVEVIEKTPELCDLKELLLEANAKGKFIIHYGL